MSSSSLNHQANNGLPICLAGIMRPLPLSKEMTDHNARREAMKKLRDQVITTERSHGRNFGKKISEADVHLIGDYLQNLRLACTAKAA